MVEFEKRASTKQSCEISGAYKSYGLGHRRPKGAEGLVVIICRLVGVKKVLSVSDQSSVESRQFLINLKIGKITQKNVTVKNTIVAMILREIGIIEIAE